MITKVLLVNMREDGPQLFALREDYTLNCIASYLESKKIQTNTICGTYKYLVQLNYLEYSPQIIVFSLDFLNKDVVSLIQYYRKILKKDIMIGAGGNFATVHHKELLEKYNIFDFIIRGSGEYTLYNFIKGLDNNELEEVKGISYLKNDKIYTNIASDTEPNLDELPFANRQVLLKNKLPIAYIASSAGCTRKCSFCSNHVFWNPENGKRWRGRTPKDFVDELEILYNQHISVFNFVDSSFEDPGVSNERMRKIATEIINRNMKIAFFVNFRVTVILNDEFDETIQLLKKAGLIGVFYGVETGNENDKKLYKKKLDSNLSVKAYNYFIKNNLSATCGFINFNPYSQIESLRKNLELIKELKLGSYFLFRSKLRVYKGTLLYEKIKSDELLTEDEYFNYGFKFVDKKVERVLEALESFFTDNNNKEIIDKFRYYCKYYIQNLKVLKRFYPTLKDELEKKEKTLNEFIDKRNEIHCKMFGELLDYVENNKYDDEVAKQIVYNINLNEAQRDIINLEKSRLNLYKKILKEDKNLDKGFLGL